MYVQATKMADYTLQIGDLGFGDTYVGLAQQVDPKVHKFLPGNHDGYYEQICDYLNENDECVQNPLQPYTVRDGKVIKFHRMPPHFIGNYGTWKVPDCDEENLAYSNEIFFVRGAWSIDQHHRTAGRDWFPCEQLSFQEAKRCYELYVETKPDVVVSHSCPYSVMNHLRLGYSNGKLIATNTNQLLEQMLNAHQPRLWAFGHFHQEFGMQLGETLFICVDMQRQGTVSSLDFNKRMEIIIPEQ